MIPTKYKANGNGITKLLTLNCNRTLGVSISDRDIDLKSLGIADTFETSVAGIMTVFQLVEKLRLCLGSKVTPDIKCTRFHIVESLKDEETDLSFQVLKTIACLRVVKFNNRTHTCTICQNMTYNIRRDSNNSSKHDKENCSPPEQPSFTRLKITKSMLMQMLPNAPENMLELLLSQFQNAGVHPKGRRWSKNVLNSSLQIYTKSPVVYKQIRDSQLLILPSPTFLLTYKNKVKHQIGFQDDLFRWMFAEAKRVELSDEGMVGGVIIDEMAIQQNLEMCKNGDAIELVGFEDTGEEGTMCSALRKGYKEKSLGTHALQFVFLGITGFRFPFSHFITTNVQAYDLHRDFWEAVGWLKLYGFTVRYVSLDGAQSNRTFMNMNIPKGGPSFVCENTAPGDPSLVFIMDASHTIKKVRNNILKSGKSDPKKKSVYTRHLELPDGSQIQWKMWENAFLWDRTNATQIHRRLTNEHMYPSSQSKMRNRLAEDVLDVEMLNMMIQYRKTLYNPDAINGAIELLKRTSKIIEIFNDRRPILCADDTRLSELLVVNEWFDGWSQGLENDKDSKKMMSYQSVEDLRSCLVGFVELCRLILDKKGSSVVPAMVNSDIVENHFCQQRATYNGANTNPTALQYRNNQNNIIFGQNLVSQKCNTGNIRQMQLPQLSYEVKPRIKRPKPQSSNLLELTRIPLKKMK